MAKQKKITVPAKSLFHANIVASKTIAGTARCVTTARIVFHPLNSLNPSKENKHKKQTNKMDKILGLQCKNLFVIIL
jgi:hypothetical protein